MLSFVLSLIASASGVAFCQSIHVGSPQSILRMQDRPAHLPMFPDAPISAVKIGEDYLLFSSGHVVDEGEGTLRMKGSLESFRPDPVNPTNGLPAIILRKGVNPELGDYDRDYSGGGSVYFDKNSNTLLYFYHSEYHWDQSNPFWAYSSIGLAISYDLGKNFTKIGQIIQPNIPQSRQQKIWVGSGEVLAKDGFFYLYYNDQSSDSTESCGRRNYHCITVARAEIKSVILAALQRKIFPWKKYYKGSFSEPGIGGKFSSLFEPQDPSNNIFGMATVRFSSYLKKYLMVYQNGTKGLLMRTSVDAINWTNQKWILQTYQKPDGLWESPYYPSLIDSGSDPNVLGQSFWLYYTNFDYGKGGAGDPNPKHHWPYAGLERRLISTE